MTATSSATGGLAVEVAFSSATPLANGWYNVFNVDGVSFSFHSGPIVAAPGFNLSSLGVLSVNGAGCTTAFFMDPAPTLNGKAVAAPKLSGGQATVTSPIGGRRHLAQSGSASVSFDMLLLVNALGVPLVPEDVVTSRSFVPVPFPATSGFVSTYAPVTVSPSTLSACFSGTALVYTFFLLSRCRLTRALAVTVGAGSAVAPAFPGLFSFFGLESI